METGAVQSVPGKKLAVLGGVLLLVVGLLIAGIAALLARDLTLLQRLTHGVQQSELFGLLAAGLVGVFVVFCLVVFFFAVGVVCLMVGVAGEGYRAPWVWVLFLLLAVALLGGFPWGTVLGAGIFIYLWRSRKEYWGARVPDSTPVEPPVSERPAGFWRRAMALILDQVLVAWGVFLLVLLLGVVSPDWIRVETPWGLFTTTRTLSREELPIVNTDQSTSIQVTERIETTVLRRWIYWDRVVTLKHGGKSETTRTPIDPITGLPSKGIASRELELLALLIYWVLLERSRLQGSVGKRVMGIRVVNQKGGRPSGAEAMERNLFKALSAVLGFVGFMMAGWTARKQGLHDKIARCRVIRG